MNEMATDIIPKAAKVVNLENVIETELDQTASAIEVSAASLSVTSDVDFQIAGDLARQIKAMQKKVKEYWEPMRVSAKKAYDDVLAHKKQMTDPLDKAEKIVKAKMNDYTREQERIRRAKEAELQRLAREEAERKLQEAAAAEAAGDATGAEFAMAEAEIMEDLSIAAPKQFEKPKTAGVSQTKTWQIVSVDESKVPVNVGGVCVRPVDTAAILKIIKNAKGDVSIPGVVFEETYSISVRA